MSITLESLKYSEESLYKFLWENEKLNSILTWLENVRLIENWWPVSLLKSTEWRWREIKGEEASLNNVGGFENVEYKYGFLFPI